MHIHSPESTMLDASSLRSPTLRYPAALDRAGLARCATAAAVALCAALPSAAQNPFPGALWVSTEADLPALPGLAAQDDASVLRVQVGAAPRQIQGPGHWQACLGAVPGDIDALAFRPGIPADRYDAVAYSLLAGELGVLDGDVVTRSKSGTFDVLIPESAFMLAMGALGANIDLDALAFDDVGGVLYSLQSDLDTPILGPVLDGDVLRLDPSGLVTRVASEADVQVAMTTVTGSIAAIVDVVGLEWVSGTLWVTTQGPNPVDGTVLVLAAPPYLLATETEFGLGGAELDALALVPPAAQIATLGFDFTSSVPGGTIQGRIEGGVPFSPIVVLAGGGAGTYDLSSLPGFGALLLDPADPWLVAAVSIGHLSTGLLDAAGSLSVGFQLPNGLLGGSGWIGENGWTFQPFELAPLRTGAPCRILL
jgi:hypothetical protein